MNGRVVGDGTVGETYNYAWLFRSDANVDAINIQLAGHWNSFNPALNNAPVHLANAIGLPNSLVFYKAGLRLATLDEARGNVAFPELRAG